MIPLLSLHTQFPARGFGMDLDDTLKPAVARSPLAGTVIMGPSKPAPVANLDTIRIFYAAVCCTWTVLVALGMGYLWHHRRMPILKIRGLGLTFVAIGVLHIYFIIVQLVSIVSPFPSEAQVRL